jgi:hypothetical protein
MKRFTLVTALLAATGCAHYAYVPQSPTATAAVFGRTAATYEIPTASPHGELRVIAYGIDELAPGDPDNDDDTTKTPGFNALHLRVIVTNTGQKPWTFDTREQSILLAGKGASMPAFVAADREGDGSQPPVIKLEFAQTRIADLFYALPPDLRPDALPGFAAQTIIHTDDDATTETTVFGRTSIGMFTAWDQDERTMTDVYDEDQYNYAYWDSPFWFNDGFTGFAGVPRRWIGSVYSRGWTSSTGFAHNAYWRRGGDSSPNAHGGTQQRGNGSTNNRRNVRRGGGGGRSSGGGHGGGHRK